MLRKLSAPLRTVTISAESVPCIFEPSPVVPRLWGKLGSLSRDTVHDLDSCFLLLRPTTVGTTCAEVPRVEVSQRRLAFENAGCFLQAFTGALQPCFRLLCVFYEFPFPRLYFPQFLELRLSRRGCSVFLLSVLDKRVCYRWVRLQAAARAARFGMDFSTQAHREAFVAQVDGLCVHLMQDG